MIDKKWIKDHTDMYFKTVQVKADDLLKLISENENLKNWIELFMEPTEPYYTKYCEFETEHLRFIELSDLKDALNGLPPPKYDRKK